jgi:pimeloyl-ACP methyl ester carboxylesterase
MRSRAWIEQFRKPPPGKPIELGNGEACFVREVGPGPRPATILRPPGGIASGGLDWIRSFGSLAERYRILAPDFYGHARGRSDRDGFGIENRDDFAPRLMRRVRAVERDLG